MSNLERLERIVQSENSGDEFIDNGNTLFRVLPALLEIVKKAIQFKNLAPVDTEGLALNQLLEAIEKFNEVKL